MDISTAKEIVYALSRGVNPATGEVLADESCFNQPNVIRALFVAHESLEASLRHEKRKSALPENAGKPWNSSEDEKLSALFEQGLSIAQLAQEHKRSQGSIRSRLEKLGKIEPADENR